MLPAACIVAGVVCGLLSAWLWRLPPTGWHRRDPRTVALRALPSCAATLLLGGLAALLLDGDGGGVRSIAAGVTGIGAVLAGAAAWGTASYGLFDRLMIPAARRTPEIIAAEIADHGGPPPR